MHKETPSPLLIFDFVDKHGRAQRRIFSNPMEVISANSVVEVHPALRKIQRMVSQGYFAAGYISYEAAPAFDPAFRVCSHQKMPLLWFGIFAKPDTGSDLCWEENYTISSWESDTTRKQYVENIQKIKRAISQGETYQVNYTMRLRSRFEGDDLGYYHRLRRAQRTDYSAYLNIGRFRILSVSPELFFKLDGNTVITRPMKGTMPRGRWLEEDQELASRLSASQKNQAENVMIVDLLRNDLSKIPGVTSVQVPRLFEIETYPTVHQMTSTVTATVRETPTFIDVLQALFPCGSITGAPKISTMGLISDLEQNPREIYCGTIGIIEPNGDAMFNVAIRSVLIDGETGLAEYGVGGGITWDSTTDGEYTEAFTKAAFLEVSDVSFELLETLKLEHGEYALLHRHLSRLASSARFFDIPIDLDMIIDRLQEHASQFEGMRRRVRLLVSRTGEVRIESTALNDLSCGVQTVALADTPVSKEDRFFYHKTTRRDVYKHHQNEHPNVFDVLLWNEDGQITDSSFAPGLSQ
ncbi:aminodeoxychorismate synthase component I [Alicyclobacillus contaminans]|uniref:aminodeoxychorismate synthase component I n=1 Tax=Alicyclobacillus contaminans TaxID=392016 RepID=UPI0003FF1451|nr:aminodeoxychorismate synthase component I [Alicyclobacillus contaminans]